jgi:putative ABC transport system substrate-binding protein
MRRREFVKFAGSAAISWPFMARAQRPERLRRIGVLMNQAADDQELQARVAAFVQALEALGWADGRNVQIEFRWAGGDSSRIHKYAAELVALAPDVILTTGGFGVAPLQRETTSIPIVFVSVADPVGSGFVSSLARPGGNTTGFANFEYSISAKWLELLKQIAPQITRAAVIRDASVPAGTGLLGALQAVAPSLGIELRPIGPRDPGEIETAVAAFARGPNGGLIATPGAAVLAHRQLIIELAARHRLPTIYPYRFFVTEGGLISYGPNTIDQYRRAASYVDRILKGEKPYNLPVQTPTKFELVINMKTAQALGLSVPQPLLARADEVIE